MGCEYRNNAKAWMMQSIFHNKEFDRRMVNRSVLIILENCSSHLSVGKLPCRISLQNTTVLYLPLNTTSKINRTTKASSVALEDTIGAASTVSFGSA